MSNLAEIQEIIEELQPDERAALRDWLNGYDGNALIFWSPFDSVCQGWVDGDGEGAAPRMI